MGPKIILFMILIINSLCFEKEGNYSKNKNNENEDIFFYLNLNSFTVDEYCFMEIKMENLNFEKDHILYSFSNNDCSEQTEGDFQKINSNRTINIQNYTAIFFKVKKENENQKCLIIKIKNNLTGNIIVINTLKNNEKIVMCNLNAEYISVPYEESYFFFLSNFSNFYTSIEYNETEFGSSVILFKKGFEIKNGTKEIIEKDDFSDSKDILSGNDYISIEQYKIYQFSSNSNIGYYIPKSKGSVKITLSNSEIIQKEEKKLTSSKPIIKNSLKINKFYLETTYFPNIFFIEIRVNHNVKIDKFCYEDTEDTSSKKYTLLDSIGKKEDIDVYDKYYFKLNKSKSLKKILFVSEKNKEFRIRYLLYDEFNFSIFDSGTFQNITNDKENEIKRFILKYTNSSQDLVNYYFLINYKKNEFDPTQLNYSMITEEINKTFEFPTSNDFINYTFSLKNEKYTTIFFSLERKDYKGIAFYLNGKASFEFFSTKNNYIDNNIDSIHNEIESFSKKTIFMKNLNFFELKLNSSHDSNIYIEVSFPAEIKTHKFLYTYINQNVREREYKLLVTSSSKKDSLNSNNNIYNYQIEKNNSASLLYIVVQTDEDIPEKTKITIYNNKDNSSPKWFLKFFILVSIVFILSIIIMYLLIYKRECLDKYISKIKGNEIMNLNEKGLTPMMDIND